MSDSYLEAVASRRSDTVCSTDVPANIDELVDDLIYAARAGDMEDLSAALAAGAPVDGRDSRGTTALMMAAANGHLECCRALLTVRAAINVVNDCGNTALHWAVFAGGEAVIKVLLEAGGCDLTLKNANGCTAAMDAERAGKGELVLLLLESLDGDEDAAAAALGHGEEDEETTAQEEAAVLNGMVGRLTGKSKGERLQVLLREGGTHGGKKPYVLPQNLEYLHRSQRAAKRAAEPKRVAQRAAHRAEHGSSPASSTNGGAPLAVAAAAAAPVLVTRSRPEDHPEVVERVGVAAAHRRGDWRYSVLPNVVPSATILRLSRDFFRVTQLLVRDGNTFGPEFEQQYAGHRNYFYYMNRNAVVAGAEKAAPLFEELDRYTRQVVELHHPGVRAQLERAFGAYYEGEEREGFHRGVNEHCDGDANLVSTVVHAVLPDGDVGFSSGGELTISEVDDLPAAPISHTNASVGSVVYLGGSVFHHATPIAHGGRRLVFCMFYANACEGEEGDLSHHALA